MPMIFPATTSRSNVSKTENLTRDPFSSFKQQLGREEIMSVTPSAPTLSRYALSKVNLDTSWLTTPQKDCLKELVLAGNALDSLFWKQMTPHGFEIKEMLECALPYIKDEKLKQKISEYHDYLVIHHGYYDQINGDKKFAPSFTLDESLHALTSFKPKSAQERKELKVLGLELLALSYEMYSNPGEEKPKGAAFYPRGLSEFDINFEIWRKRLSKTNRIFEKLSKWLEKAATSSTQTRDGFLLKLAEAAKARTAAEFENKLRQINTLVKGKKRGGARYAGWKLKTVLFEKEYRKTLEVAVEHMLNAAKIISPIPNINSEEDIYRYLNANSDVLLPTEAMRDLGNARFALYLKKRAKAMLSGKKTDWDDADIAWLELKSPDINFMVGAVETYDDKLPGFGVKASYEACLTIKDTAATEKAQKFKKLMPDFVAALQCADEFRNKNVEPPEIDYVNAVSISGHVHGAATAIAYSLPNDPKITDKYGSRATQIVNLTEAKTVNDVRRKTIMDYFIDEGISSKFTPNDIMDGLNLRLVLHEDSHPLGLSLDDKGEIVDPRKPFGEFHNPLAELRAYVVGMGCAEVALQKGATTKKELEAACLDVVLDGLGWAFKQRELVIAHAKGGLMEFNYLFEKGAITMREGRYSFDLDKMISVESDLARELLKIWGKGDKPAAKEFIEKYANIPEHMNRVLAQMDAMGLPKFIYPVLPDVSKI